MRRLFFLVCLLVPAVGWTQTNPCRMSSPSFIVVTSMAQIYATLPEYLARFKGQPILTEVELAAFARGADPMSVAPLGTGTLSRTEWSLVAGTPACYRAAVPFLANVPAQQPLDLYLRSRGPGGVGSWTGPIPFGRPGPPPPASPTWIVLTP